MRLHVEPHPSGEPVHVEAPARRYSIGVAKAAALEGGLKLGVIDREYRVMAASHMTPEGAYLFYEWDADGIMQYRGAVRVSLCRCDAP